MPSRSTSGWRRSPAPPARPSAPSSSTGCSRSCPSTPPSAPASTPSSPTRRSTACSPSGRRPIVVGGTGLYLRAALTELSLRPVPAEGVRERWIAELEARGPEALHADAGPPRALGGRDDRAHRSPAHRARPGAARQRRARAALRRIGAVDRRHAPQHAAGRAGHGPRGALRAHRRPRRPDARRRRAGRGPAGAQRGRLGHGAQGAGLRGPAQRGHRADEAPHAQLRPPPADLDAQAGRRRRDRPDRRGRPQDVAAEIFAAWRARRAAATPAATAALRTPPRTDT